MPLMPAPKKYHWNPEKDAVLRAHYTGKRGQAKVVAAKLGWPTYQICKRASLLGLSKPRKHKPWTQEDIDKLENLIGINTVETIAAKLGRTVFSVRNQIYARGHSGRISEGYTLASLSECFGVDHHAVRRWLRLGLLKGREEGSAWRFSDSDVIAFIRKNPHEFKLSRVDQTWFMDLMLNPRNLN